MAVLYGNQGHAGEFHKSGFREIEVKKIFEAHEMGCLLANAVK